MMSDLTFVAKALMPLSKVISGESPLSLLEAEKILTMLLVQIDQRPLQSFERKEVQNQITVFMKVNNINPSNLIIQQLSTRLGYTYFPTISPSNVPKTVKNTK